MGRIALQWVDDHMFVVSDSNNHSVVVGRSTNGSGEWAGVKPSDMLLMSVAACTAWDVVEILIKQRQPVIDFKIDCEGTQQSEAPYTFTCIHLHYRITGDVDLEKVERAIRLSEEKYCSVISTLRPGVPISSDFEVLPI